MQFYLFSVIYAIPLLHWWMESQSNTAPFTFSLSLMLHLTSLHSHSLHHAQSHWTHPKPSPATAFISKSCLGDGDQSVGTGKNSEFLARHNNVLHLDRIPKALQNYFWALCKSLLVCTQSTCTRYTHAQKNKLNVSRDIIGEIARAPAAWRRGCNIKIYP